MKIGIDFIGVTTPFICHDGMGNFLLHKRSQHCRDEQGSWDSGSGKLEHGQTIAENVLREIREEYGCEADIQEVLPAIDIFRNIAGINTHWVSIPHIVRVNPNNVKNNEPTKIDELGWFTIHNFPEPLHTGFAFTLKTYRDRIEKYT